MMGEGIHFDISDAVEYFWHLTCDELEADGKRVRRDGISEQALYAIGFIHGLKQAMAMAVRESRRGTVEELARGINDTEITLHWKGRM